MAEQLHDGLSTQVPLAAVPGEVVVGKTPPGVAVVVVNVGLAVEVVVGQAVVVVVMMGSPYLQVPQQLCRSLVSAKVHVNELHPKPLSPYSQSGRGGATLLYTHSPSSHHFLLPHDVPLAATSPTQVNEVVGS